MTVPTVANRLNRRRFVTLSAGMAALAAAGCARGGAPAPAGGAEPVAPASEIDLVYAFDVLFTEPLTRITERLRATKGITVNLVLAGEGYEEADRRVQTDLAAGSPPALAMVGLNRVLPYVESGRAVPLDGFLAGDPAFDRNALYPRFLDLMRFRDQTYGLPYVVSTPVLYVNADHLRAAGLDPDRPPQTWSEVQRAADALVDGAVARHGVSYTWDITGNWLFQAQLESNGGRLLDAQGRPAFAEPPGVGVLEHWAGLVDAGLMPLVQETEARDMFVRGDLSMLVTSTAYLTTAEKQAPFDLRTSLMPVPDGGRRATPAGGNGMVVLAEDPAEQAAAWELVKALTDVEGCTTTITATGYMPVNRAAAESQQHLAPYLADPNRATSLRQIETLVPWLNMPGTRGREITEVIEQALFAGMHGDAAPAAALAAAADSVRELLP